MAKAKARGLKVFEARLGFYDTVVAAPSQAAALSAWGLRQNLFAEGQARVATDPAAVAAALAHPGTPLKRAAGLAGAFEVEPAALPTVPAGPKRAPARTKAKARPAPPPRPPTDRAALDAAEAALADLDAARKRQEARFRHRQAELDAERAEALSAYVAARKAASAALAEARRAYRKAGGE